MEIFVLVRKYNENNETKIDVVRASVDMIELEELRDVIDERWYQAKEKYASGISSLSQEIAKVFLDNQESIELSAGVDLDDLCEKLAKEWEELQLS